MKTIALCSTARGVGKTTVGAFLCEQFGQVAAVKVMPRHRMLVSADTREERSPEEDRLFGARLQHEASVSDAGGISDVQEWSSSAAAQQGDEENEQPAALATADEERKRQATYRVVDDPNQLLLRGSDTRRFWDAGAEPVVWVRAQDEQVLEALDAVRKQLAEAEAEPALLLIESNRYVRDGGAADATLLVYPNGSEDLGEMGADLLPRADALVVTKRRPGPVKLALLDDENFPAEKFDLPAFAFNLDEDSLALDDRYALLDWMRRRLDMNAVNADEACRAV